MWPWQVKDQLQDPEQCWKPFFDLSSPFLKIFEDILMRLMPFYRGSHCPLNGFTAVFQSLIIFNNIIIRSILATILICHLNLKIAPFTTLVKVKIKVLVTQMGSQSVRQNNLTLKEQRPKLQRRNIPKMWYRMLGCLVGHKNINKQCLPKSCFSVIISPKFEISGMLWFWSGRRRRIRRRRRRRTPRLVFHVTATPMRVSNSYLTQPLIP